MATLVDPSVMYLLQQKREEGLFSSLLLGELLAPNMGVKVQWASSNRIEHVEAAAIRLVQEQLNWPQQQQQQQQQQLPLPQLATSSLSSLHPFRRPSHEQRAVDNRKHLISRLRESSTLAEEAIRQQYMPLAMRRSSSPQSALLAAAANEERFHQQHAKRRKLGNNNNSGSGGNGSFYPSWLQEKRKSVAPDSTAMAALAAARHQSRGPPPSLVTNAAAAFSATTAAINERIQRINEATKILDATGGTTNPRRVSDYADAKPAAAAAAIAASLAAAGSKTTGEGAAATLAANASKVPSLAAPASAETVDDVAVAAEILKSATRKAEQQQQQQQQQQKRAGTSVTGAAAAAKPPVADPTTAGGTAEAGAEGAATTATGDADKSTGPSWEYMYGRLLKHMEERGLDKAPTRVHMDPQLRTWVAQQRLDFKKRNMNSERQFLLRSVGFHRDKFTLKWDAKFERLRAFKREHGHTNVPFHYAKDRQLGTWVSKQRVRIRQGTISDEEKVRLEAIGFVPNRFNARWEEMFRRLVAYKKTYGDANVPRVYDKDPQLAQWVLNQKDNFREGKMKPDRQIKLEAIGFSWSTFYEGDLEWEANFKKLLTHKAVHGHVRFFKDPKLARWVALQQSLQSMGTLDRQRMGLLISIGVLPARPLMTAQTATLTDSEVRSAAVAARAPPGPPSALRASFSPPQHRDWDETGGAESATFL